MRGTVISDTQRELFGELAYRALGTPPRPNAHGVFEPDETLAVYAQRLQVGAGGKSRPRLAIASIDLVHIPGQGWLFAWHFSLSMCGAGFAPALKWRDTLRPTRQEAIDGAREAMTKSIASHTDQGRCKLGRVVSAWLAAGCPAE